MKSWPWRRILACTAVALIVIGAGPLAYLFWWGSVHNLQPLSFLLPLKRGVYTSPSFITDANDTYQVDIYFLPPQRTQLDLDWKIVDDAGAVIQSGSYTDPYPGGNSVTLAEYRPKRGLRQRVIVNIHQDVQWTDTQHMQATDAQPSLHVGLPERGLEMAYGSAAGMMWAAIVAGPGVLLLIGVSIFGRRDRKTPVPVA